MNYRHAFHAGNFADVVKHVVLSRIILYLRRKEGAFRVIDTHAGRGSYDLSSEEATRTGEWRHGIGRLVEARLEPASRDLLAPYLDIIASLNKDGGIMRYPGSPLIVRRLLRRQDRLTALEMHPAEAAALKSLFAGDHQVRVTELDGWLALGAHLPPREKRGLVLVDPPFERPGEFERLADGLGKAWKRWPGGTYALWYPIKDRAAVAQFRKRLKAAAIPDILDITLEVKPPSPDPRLDGCGMIVVNPPYILADEMNVILPALQKEMAEHGSAAATAVRLAA